MEAKKNVKAMEKPKRRPPTNILTDDELKFFYEKILLFCESDGHGYGTFSKFSKSFLKPFELCSENYEAKLKEFQKNGQEPPCDTFYFSAIPENGTKAIEGQLWFRHLRNAFAHNYITKEEGCMVLQDYYKEGKSTKCTLYVKISSFDEFKALINRIQEKINNPKK